MIVDIMTVHITEAELARDVRAALENVRRGVEVVIERGNQPVAVLKAVPPTGRRISEVVASLEHSGASAVLDEDFARDVDEGIRSGGPERRAGGLRARVRRDGQLLIDRAPSARIAFEVRTRNEAFDIAPILAAYRASRHRAS
jgi:antitoxin (DNA-binding transcriptional repressor) of toxin-antitoxin stability system